MRVAELGIPLVDREEAAEREQHDRDDEGPEVANPPEPQRMKGCRCAPRATAAENEQALIARVRDNDRTAAWFVNAGR
jgi:hypothetical protein